MANSDAASGRKRGRKTPRQQIGMPISRPLNEFAATAKFLMPDQSDPPEWLLGHLRRSCSSIFMSYAVEILQPSRAEMRRALSAVENAAATLVSALSDNRLLEFLAAGDSPQRLAPGNLQAALSDLRNRAVGAARSPTLIKQNGKTKAGKGRAAPEGAISGQTYCALFIAETWRYLRGDSPPPRNRQAAQAAENYWRLCGGERISWGTDTLTAWKRHFGYAAKANSAEVEGLRLEIRRHLRESEAHAAPSNAASSEGT